MSNAPPSRDRAAGNARLDQDRLAHGLVSRGLVTPEEVKACRSGEERGPEALLDRLVSAGHLTAGQARRAAQELDALLGEQIPGYQLLRKLGQGAMGAVFEARQVSMNRLVAVKVLHGKLAADPEFLTRFTREAHLAAQLSHNNIIQAIDVGSAGNLHYFVMELVEGRTLREEIDAGTIYEEREAVGIVLQVAQALAHAHKRGLIHRDIKPSNIVLTDDGVAKLADLGLARSTGDKALARRERGLTIGTPYYISPEQIEGAVDIDGRADLYGLGATLYHMVTGQPPFASKDVEEVLEGHLHDEVVPPDHLNEHLSAGLGEVVEVLLAKDRRDRYRNAEDLIIDLECLLVGEPPKVARPHIAADALAALAEGEDEEDDRPEGWPGWFWPTILGALLGLSLLVNLLQLMRRG